MNYAAIITAVALQPAIGRDRIIKINGRDSVVDPVGAVLIYCGINPLELQYYCNVPNEKLWDHFSALFIALDLTLDELGLLFHLVDAELPKTLDPKARRDKVINKLLQRMEKN